MALVIWKLQDLYEVPSSVTSYIIAPSCGLTAVDIHVTAKVCGYFLGVPAAAGALAASSAFEAVTPEAFTNSSNARYT